jgi:hypothetical protein
MKEIDRVKNYTKSPVERLSAMVSALNHIDGLGIGGDVVECGVWRGGNIILTRLISPKRRCWLYDTFDGMPEPGAIDVKRSGESAFKLWKAKNRNGHKMAAVSVTNVRMNLKIENVYDEWLTHFVVGDVCETLNDPDNIPEKIALLRLDTDWYRSTKKEMEVLYPRLASGGVLILDDYGHWMGARTAVQEYFKKKGISYADKLHPIDYSASMMVKP